MAGEFHPICIALAGFTASGDFHSALRTKKEIAGMIVPYTAGGVKPDADSSADRPKSEWPASHQQVTANEHLIKVQEPPLLERALKIVWIAVIDRCIEV